MATATVRIQHADRFTVWFPDFLRRELAPYPGRGAIVARTVIAATITMIVMVTFHIPGGAIGVLFAFTLAREDLAATAKSALALVSAFALAGLFIPIGARFFAAEPLTHFVWEGVSLLVSFFLLKTLNNYAVAIGLSLVTTNILSIWYLPGPVERNIELTLWQVVAALIGAMVTFAVEAVFHAISQRDEVLDGVESRLELMQKRMECYSAGTAPTAEAENLLAQFAIVGVGGMRRHLARGTYEPLQRMRLSTLVSLTGRSVDFAAALSSSMPALPPELKPRAEQLARHIADIRHCLKTKGEPCESDFEPEPCPTMPLLFELESMVSLMPTVFSSRSAIDPRLDVLEAPASSAGIFVQDAFSNPENIRYVLGGTLAAMLCYVLYVGLAWPGISTSVTTCVLTALTNVGASRQKQVLRLGGALLGGFVFGLGAQIFILPSIDSITGFTVLFATVTAIAAWVGTSSARLSYAGVQIALAFYLIQLSDFRIQTSLTVARDRSIGVVIGITMMWLVFERFYSRSAADEMIRIFAGNLRLMADLMGNTPLNADTVAVLKIRRQREQIYRNFGSVNAQSDAVPFETGARRSGDMAARDRIRRWQASLRTFYLMEAPLLQFRVFSTGAERSGSFARIEESFRSACAQGLRGMAANLESQGNQQGRSSERGPRLKALLQRLCNDRNTDLSEREKALLAMSQTIASLLDRMLDEAASEALYAAR
ncbi:MAG TPA: FUSC family protein [Terracidiphilus sp.]|jgi:multidrug resistance protein MdtO|nr:FUSC family protein [Terracidiphilus sp.]